LEEIALKEGNHLLRLNGVFGDLIIVLPKKAPVSVVASTTFGTVRIKDRSSSGVSGHLSYISDGYQEAPGKLFIQAHQVFGDLRVF
jgi:predicted membrane protein